MEKYTYIRKHHKGYYLETDSEIDEEYWDGQIGETYQDFNDGKWILLSDEQVRFHEENPNASIEEVLNMELYYNDIIAEQPIKSLQQVRRDMIKKIEQYDKSTNVNNFTINGTINTWFTVEERSNYRSSIDAAKTLNVDKLQFFINNMPIEITTQEAEYMLASIQLYADQCFLITKQHKLNVNKLRTIYDVESYQYTKGYPPQLNFNVDFKNDEESEEENETVSEEQIKE